MPRLSTYYCGALLLFALGCGSKSEPAAPPAPPPAPAPAPAAPPPAPPADPAAEAKTYFTQTCVVCHGANGKGDGPGAAALNPKPRNYSDPTWQASVSDEQIAKTIVQGGAAVGKSPIMPANPQLKDKPEVVAELVKIIRAFKE